ncbi:MAG TPA: type II toxin-antitoxin system PemK/MazF family toxin [Tepidisphaeraceae bacterium]|nr:type II toxin-antitoxin system PemK/MazF family toxin [Tepidisphaeraceae bacterium]
MARETYIPDLGDLIHMTFSPSTGREQTGPRYAVVLTPKSYSRASGLALCCPITSKVKGYPFEVAVGGSVVQGVVLCDHVRSIDFRERNAVFIEKARRDVIDDVTAMVLPLVDPRAL